MKIQHGDMWKTGIAYDELYVTGNATIKNNGELVMGRGAAREAALRYPYLAAYFGSVIGDRPVYLLIPPSERVNVGLFQVKHHFQEKATLDLIKHSAMALAVRARLHPAWRFALNFPGIGDGGLEYGEVSPIIEWVLPDNVDVWLYATKKQLEVAGL